MNQENSADPMSQNEVSRRRFLEAAGFSLSMATISGCWRAPTRTAMPHSSQPQGVVPGQTNHYAAVCQGCSAACGLLVGVRDGRPLKMEGLPAHPLSAGGLCAVGQASPLALYDNHRLDKPMLDQAPATWEEVDKKVKERLASAGKGAVRFLTSTVLSPTLKNKIDSFLGRFADARHVVWDEASFSSILDAHEKTHGQRVLPHYRLDRAKTIVAFGADFLSSWLSPVEFAAAWKSQRVPTTAKPEMSHHTQLEGRMSLTGSNADERLRLAPDEFGVVLSHLAAKLAKKADRDPPQGELGESPLGAKELDGLVERLWHSKGHAIVLCDSSDTQVQQLVNFVNDVIGAYGTTVDIANPSRQKAGSDSELLKLFEELEAGKVSILLVAGVDLIQQFPARETLATALKDVSLVVSFTERADGLSPYADAICPDHQALETWSDAEPVKGLVGISQPVLRPLKNTRSILETLSNWSGKPQTAYEAVRDYWRKSIYSKVKSEKSFAKFWNQVVHDGFKQLQPGKPSNDDLPAFRSDSVKTVAAASDSSCLSLYHKAALPHSRHAHNPWLQELPDPVTKATWDNYVCVSPHRAEQLGVSDGDVVQVRLKTRTSTVELPVLIQPGQHDRVIAMALGYGVAGTERFEKIGPQWLEAKPTVEPGKPVGRNVAGLVKVVGKDSLLYHRNDFSIEPTDKKRPLARTQLYSFDSVPKHVAPPGAEVRHPVQATSLAEFTKDPHSGAESHHHSLDQQLWAEDHPKEEHWWGLAIDLNACTGCSACLVACQSENNVPVVGRDEVVRQREMHWIRIDRYYHGEADDIRVRHQPMMCQHCNNAPCETVCPVLATVHNEEGLNEQVYNRCVGTRYCANNCPYKVRRFNWFNYPQDEYSTLALNPDVTVRSRGVMEKCSMCAQRIEIGKIAAKSRGVTLGDGDIRTACQQSCPTQAIVFGDMNDKKSAISKALHDERNYHVLEEFNFRPNVSYLRVVENRTNTEATGGGHG